MEILSIEEEYDEELNAKSTRQAIIHMQRQGDAEQFKSAKDFLAFHNLLKQMSTAFERAHEYGGYIPPANRRKPSVKPAGTHHNSTYDSSESDISTSSEEDDEELKLHAKQTQRMKSNRTNKLILCKYVSVIPNASEANFAPAHWHQNLFDPYG